MKHLLKMNEENFEHYEIPNRGIIVLEFDDDNNYVNNNVIRY